MKKNKMEKNENIRITIKPEGKKPISGKTETKSSIFTIKNKEIKKIKEK